MGSVTAINPRRPRFISPRIPSGLAGSRARPAAAAPRSLVHMLALGLVWLAVASSAVVFTEPAPTDLLTIAALVVLPVVGLAVFRPPLIVVGGVLTAICAAGFIATLYASDTQRAATHMAISLYLALAAVVLGAFVARNPQVHARLLLQAHLAGALLVALAGIVGYFDLIPYAREIFTKFDRASGTFKDPNVFGPYLVPAIVYTLHVWLNRPLGRGLVAASLLAVLSLGLLLSFSRGAWAGAGIAVLIYLYINFVTTRRDLDRLRILALVLAGAAALVLVLIAALQFDQVEKLLDERANLAQTYDIGPEGRFGGHEKAFGVLIDNPFGIGALEFPQRYHHEDVHNVYLSMYLNAGWVGGSLHLLLVLVTMFVGLRHALRRTRTQGYFIIAYAALFATFLQGLLIDTDHWRHLYLLLGMVWALMGTDRAAVRATRIKADRRPVLLQPVIVLPPTRRPSRIIGHSAQIIELRPRRPARLIGDFNRQPRILSRIPPHRPVRLLHGPAAAIARFPATGNDNLPPAKR